MARQHPKKAIEHIQSLYKIKKEISGTFYSAKPQKRGYTKTKRRKRYKYNYLEKIKKILVNQKPA